MSSIPLEGPSSCPIPWSQVRRSVRSVPSYGSLVSLPYYFDLQHSVKDGVQIKCYSQIQSGAYLYSSATCWPGNVISMFKLNVNTKSDLQSRCCSLLSIYPTSTVIRLVTMYGRNDGLLAVFIRSTTLHYCDRGAPPP